MWMIKGEANMHHLILLYISFRRVGVMSVYLGYSLMEVNLGIL